MNSLVLHVSLYAPVKYTIQMLYISDHVIIFWDRSSLGLQIIVLNEGSYDYIQRVGGKSPIEFFHLIAGLC